jgi:hypothetical protein
MLELVGALQPVVHAAHPLAACVVPNPAPTDAGLPGAAQLNTILGWARWLAIAFAIMCICGCGGLMAGGALWDNGRVHDFGRRAFPWCVIGGLVIGIGPLMVQAFYTLGEGTGSC